MPNICGWKPALPFSNCIVTAVAIPPAFSGATNFLLIFLIFSTCRRKRKRKRKRRNSAGGQTRGSFLRKR